MVGVPDADQGELAVAIIKQWPEDGKVKKQTLEAAVTREVGEEASLSDVLTTTRLPRS